MSNYSTGIESILHILLPFQGAIIYASRISLCHPTYPFFFSLLLRRECCSFSNGEYVKAGLAELEHWCYKATDEVFCSHLCSLIVGHTGT